MLPIDTCIYICCIGGLISMLLIKIMYYSQFRLKCFYPNHKNKSYYLTYSWWVLAQFLRYPSLRFCFNPNIVVVNGILFVVLTEQIL